MAQSEPNRSAVAAAMVCCGAVSAQFVAGKATRDALFLANADVTMLPADGGGDSGRLDWPRRPQLVRAAPHVHRSLLMPAAFAVQRRHDGRVDWLLVDVFAGRWPGRSTSRCPGLGPILGRASG